MLAGHYLYVDHPGADPQPVHVTYIEGPAYAVFTEAAPEDAGLECLVRDMAGEFIALRANSDMPTMKPRISKPAWEWTRKR